MTEVDVWNVSVALWRFNTPLRFISANVGAID